ncbi:RAF2 [Drosophila busckii]|uniref:RAF2 n=1 Tax=Drosophila busckii TaxID=30019 RepID=A0A0M4EME5_DROBS|nr:RAF2 [Drosophila busckii]
MMTNVELYDSSNSQLSSDEYSNNEEDDGLMDMAVSKSTKSPKRHTLTSSTDTTPEKSSSASTTPRKLSNEMETSGCDDGNGDGKPKPPTSLPHTRRQIKQMQRDNRANIYYKKRSIKWLIQNSINKKDYLNELKNSLPKHREHARRMDEYREAKRAIELEAQARQQLHRQQQLHHQMQQRRERTPPRRPTRSDSNSPELICLDDTENEESPDKPSESSPPVPSSSVLVAPKTPPAFTLEIPTSPPPAENGCVLDEFLTMKPLPAVEQPISNNLPVRSLEMDLSTILSDLKEVPVVEQSNKRRRSVTPPNVHAVPAATEQRHKTIAVAEKTPQVDLITELYATPAAVAAPPKAAPINAAIVKAAPEMAIDNPPMFKLGGPFTLSEFYAPPKTTATPIISLETPTPTTEPMELCYERAKPAALTIEQADPTIEQAPTLETPTHTFAMPQFITPQAPAQSSSHAELFPAKPNSESSSKQTQTSATTTRSKSNIDLNNSNSDAVFHQRVKDLYSELDEIMTDKVRAVKPELKSYSEEKQRIELDLKALDKLVFQKEEEYNRLLHLRCVKEELLARLERKERILIMKEILPSILNKNCSTSELYEMHSLLLNEHNAPMPALSGPSAIEQMINRKESDLNDIKMWRSAMGMQAPANFLEPAPVNRRNSLPAMRPSKPPPPPPRSSAVSDNASASYGRQGQVRDVRSLIEDYRREHPEEVPLVGKRNKTPQQYRYQQLINESKRLTNSTPDLSAGTSYRQAQQLEPHSSHSSVDNHFEQGKPLFNSSPLNASHTRQQTRVHFAEPHSMYREELSGRAASHFNSNQPKHREFDRTANGEENFEHRCQHCHRYKATYMCAGCQNQWYCSRDCQVRAWDTHWESCPN